MAATINYRILLPVALAFPHTQQLWRWDNRIHCSIKEAGEMEKPASSLSQVLHTGLSETILGRAGGGMHLVGLRRLWAAEGCIGRSPSGEKGL
jgi:hypothetical protein